jgi:hypothetical protein
VPKREKLMLGWRSYTVRSLTMCTLYLGVDERTTSAWKRKLDLTDSGFGPMVGFINAAMNSLRP